MSVDGVRGRERENFKGVKMRDGWCLTHLIYLNFEKERKIIMHKESHFLITKTALAIMRSIEENPPSYFFGHTIISEASKKRIVWKM